LDNIYEDSPPIEAEGDKIVEGMAGGKPSATVIPEDIKNKFKNFVKNGKYTDIFYDIDICLSLIGDKFKPFINDLAGVKADTTDFDEYVNVISPSGSILSPEVKLLTHGIAWDAENSETRKKYKDIADEKNKINGAIIDDVKNDSNVIIEALRIYISTAIGVLIGYNILYSWTTKSGKKDVGEDPTPTETFDEGASKSEGGNPMEGFNPMRDNPMGGGNPMEGNPMEGNPMAGMGGGFKDKLNEAKDTFWSTLDPIIGVPGTLISFIKNGFSYSGKTVTEQISPTNLYFIVIMLSFGLVAIAQSVSNAMGNSFDSMSKGKFEKSVGIYIFIIVFWIFHSINVVRKRPEVWVNLIPGTVLLIVYIIILALNVYALAAVFNAAISLYILYRLIFLIPFQHVFNMPETFKKVYDKAIPPLTPEEKANIDSYRNKPLKLESFHNYVRTTTFLFENLFSLIFIIASFINVTILGKKLKLVFLKSSLPIVMVGFILLFIKYKYTQLFGPKC
jgi:hypothetical protein